MAEPCAVADYEFVAQKHAALHGLNGITARLSVAAGAGYVEKILEQPCTMIDTGLQAAEKCCSSATTSPTIRSWRADRRASFRPNVAKELRREAIEKGEPLTRRRLRAGSQKRKDATGRRTELDRMLAVPAWRMPPSDAPW